MHPVTPEAAEPKMHNANIGIRVECYAGHRGEETPRRLVFDRRSVEVTEIVDRWFAPDHRYFKLRGADGAAYIVRHDTGAGIWELIMYERGPAPGAPPSDAPEFASKP